MPDLLFRLKILALLRRRFHHNTDRLLLTFETQGAATVSETRIVGNVIMGAVVATLQGTTGFICLGHV